MTVIQEQIASFREACKPLQEWLIANCHPHCSVMLDSHQAELVEGICAINSNQPDGAGVKFPTAETRVAE
jgi:hypothetical protein